MSDDSLSSDHQDLLQFLYEFPIGVIDMDEDGNVSTMNPAAARLLSVEANDDESVARPIEILRRITPTLFDHLDSHPDELGMVTTGRGFAIDSSDGSTRFTISVHRMRPRRLMVSLTDVTEERRLLNEQRDRAQRLQRALLGRIDTTDLDVSVAYRPAHDEDLSGGDWYDVIKIDDDRFALVVGDVVGHDIEAAAAMGQLRAIVRAFSLVEPDPVSVIEQTENLARTIDGARFATVHYALLDRAASTVTYSSAGHPPSLVIKADGSARLLPDGRRTVLAAVDRQDRPSATTGLDVGDVLIIYSDGLIERSDQSIDVGLDRLVETARTIDPSLSVDLIVEELTATMLGDATQRDDVCVLAVRQRA